VYAFINATAYVCETISRDVLPPLRTHIGL
jgi:hypothetical protein